MEVIVDFKDIIFIISFIISFILFFTGLINILGRKSEKKSWNEGKCPKCGTKWRCFDNDSQGGRGYVCDKCKSIIWISYHVDRDRSVK